MKHNRNTRGSTNHRKSDRSRKYGYGYADRNDVRVDSFGLGHYGCIDTETNQHTPCNDVNRACSIAFGNNKKRGNQSCIAYVRTSNGFYCL